MDSFLEVRAGDVTGSRRRPWGGAAGGPAGAARPGPPQGRTIGKRYFNKIKTKKKKTHKQKPNNKKKNNKKQT
ncbi:hypothetical protein, partial [Streptomyces sp. NPDC004728]|uniref:hypothetical protein n=1 Tax=Streptomyces sp. NPDC004728 TaxID=3154289 RepID=UPI0033B4C3B4